MLLNNDDWALRDKHIDTCLSEQVGYALNFAGSAYKRGEGFEIIFDPIGLAPDSRPEAEERRGGG